MKGWRLTEVAPGLYQATPPEEEEYDFFSTLEMFERGWQR